MNVYRINGGSMKALFFGLVISIGQFAYGFEDPVLLKNFREIYAAYENITAVDGRDKELMDLYKLNMDRLPKNGLPEELSSSVVLAATELSGAFCKKTIDREKVLAPGARILFGDVNFDL